MKRSAKISRDGKRYCCYSPKEANRFDPLSRDYDVALKAMKYQELVNKNKVIG